VQRDNLNATTNQIKLNQSLETVNSIRFAGQTVTVSYYARRGANYSSASNLLTLDLRSGTGTDQNVDATYTGSATVATSSATLTTTWQRFTATGTVSASATELALIFNYTPVGTAEANDFFEVTGVQLELGSVATPFSRAGGTIQGELAACQRYYWRNAGGGNESCYGYGVATGAGAAELVINNPVPLRVVATSVESASLALLLAGVAFYGASSVTLKASASSINTTTITLNASGLTTSRMYALANNITTAGYIAFSAEL
jgi:hypothetical protein